MSQMPEIKPEVNKEPEREKKKSGLLGRLFGGGAGGAGGAGAGMGGGLGSMAAGGGLLATKAGLMALILVGTTVAGGIGLVGYRMFGPGQDQGSSDNLQLFAPKPKEATSADLQAAPKDGTSQSLTFASQANSQSKAPELAPAEAPKDASAAGAASSAESVAASHGPINAADGAGSGMNKHLLKGSGKFGALSSAFGSGGGSGGGSYSAASGGAGKSGSAEAVAAASRNGATSAMGKGRSAFGGGRSIAGRRAGKALGQAFSSLKDGRSAQTSYGAGRTFDGSATTSGGTTGPEGGNIGMGGPGTADGGQPKNLPANANSDKKEFQAPPTPTSKDAAPWQNAIKTAQGLIMLATVLMLIAKMCSRTGYGHTLAMIVAAIVAAIGIAVIALGSQISSGKYGQKLQGAMLAAAGTGLIIMAAATAFGGKDGAKDGDGLNPTGAVDDPGSTASSGKDAGFFSGVNPLVLVGGGLGLVGVAGTMMMPPQKYPSKDFENGNPPDSHWFGYQELPSQAALKKMIV